MSRWIAFSAIAASVLWSCLGLIDYGRLLAVSCGKTISERGALASDERRSFLTRAGRTRMRERLAAEDPGATPPPSAAAEAWQWCFERAPDLSPESRVHLNVPSLELYYFGSFFFHPARLEADAEGSPITGAHSLRTHLRRVKPGDFGLLAARGYSHAIVARPSGFAMVELRAPERGRGP